MRPVFPPEVESGRIRRGKFASEPHEREGAFFVTRRLQTLKIIASSGRDWVVAGLPGEPWEHVSVSLVNRCPTWDEMSFVKNLFWSEDEAVVQFHPPRSEYVNDHQYVLHLWKPPYPIVLPPTVTV